MPLSMAIRRNEDRCYVAMPPQATLADAVTAMVRQRKTAIAVMRGDGLAGLVTRTDVLASLGRPVGHAAEQMRLSEVMTTALETAGPEKSFQFALDCMASSRFEHMPVVQDGRLITVLHENELLRLQLNDLNEDINHLQDYIEGLHIAGQD